MTTLPRCPFPGCPVRWSSGGPNRECPDHQNEFHLAAAELGINLDYAWMDEQPPEEEPWQQPRPPAPPP